MSLAVTFTELVNSSFKCKRFPNVMKHTEILPFLKQKDDLIKSNYRPVSVLTVSIQSI